MTAQQVYNMSLSAAAEIAPKYGLDKTIFAQLLTSIAHKESRFNPSAVPRNKQGKAISSAIGLMQVLRKTQAWVEKTIMKTANLPHEQMYDAEYALRVGGYYFGYLMQRYGNDPDKAIWAYNQGSWSPEKYPDGAAYLKDVRKAYNSLFANSGGASVSKLDTKVSANFTELQ